MALKKTTLGLLAFTSIFLLLTIYFKKVTLSSKETSQNNAKAEISSINEIGDIELYSDLQSAPNIPQGTFYYSGELSFAALSKTGLDEKLKSVDSDFKLSYREPKFSPPGSTTGIQMLLARSISFAHSNRYLTKKEISLAESKGYQLEQIAIAIDGLAFFVHNSSSIKSLSQGQLRDIYQGKITNWQQIGGRNLPITPIALEPKVYNSLQLLYKNNQITDYPDLSSNIISVRDYTSAIRTTNSIPGAIAYGSSALIQKQNSIKPIAIAKDENSPAIPAILSDGTVNLQAFQRKVYPLTRHLSIVIPRDEGDKQRTNVGVAYANLLLSDEGQKIIQQAGFLPFRGKSNKRSSQESLII